MSETTKAAVGTIAWVDLTAPGANELADFYTAVTGWKSQAVTMGDHSDWTMTEPDNENPVAGVCHPLGANADMPPQWLIYVVVADLDASLEACRARSGSVVAGPRGLGSYGRFAVIKDPAGAFMALMQPPA